MKVVKLLLLLLKGTGKGETQLFCLKSFFTVLGNRLSVDLIRRGSTGLMISAALLSRALFQSNRSKKSQTKAILLTLSTN